MINSDIADMKMLEVVAELEVSRRHNFYKDSLATLNGRILILPEWHGKARAMP